MVLNIRILCVGHLKEAFWKDAVKEYEKRLSRYARVEVMEVPDEKAPEALSPAQAAQVKAREGERLLKLVREKDHLIALDVKGARMDSETFANHLRSLALAGRSGVCLLIGGSLGLSEEVLNRADLRLSFSDMTFSHQLMRPILMEQLYRAFKIISGETYHK